jgi:hypothetical protein
MGAEHPPPAELDERQRRIADEVDAEIVRLLRELQRFLKRREADRQ